MSQLDAELYLVRARLAALEEQKQNEMKAASEKKAFPLESLEKIINETRDGIPRCLSSSPRFYPQMYEQMKLAFLEPILDALKKINERLDVLEGNSR